MPAISFPYFNPSYFEKLHRKHKYIFDHLLTEKMKEHPKISKEEEKELVKQGQKKYENRLNSFEEVVSNLKIFGDILAEDDKYKGLIIECLLRLPLEIRERVLDEATFIMFSENALGHVFKMHIVENPTITERSRDGKMVVCDHEISVILLNFGSMKKYRKARIMTRIAHEIAHFILGHSPTSPIEGNDDKEADDLCEKWGFGRAYESYINCNVSGEFKK